MRRLWLALLITPAALAADDPAVKAKVEQADAAFKQVDYLGCAKTLESAVAAVKRGDSLEARVHKLLAICQYKAGRRTAAAANFRAAQQADPATTVTAEETGSDEAVVAFFTDVTGEKSRAKPLVEEAVATAATTDPGVTRTSLVVHANAPGAAVLIDGILAGHAGDTIAVDVGEVELEISAPGHESKKLKVNAKPATDNTVRVGLEKELPKPQTGDTPASPMEPASPASTQD
jgi:hypothetical protein